MAEEALPWRRWMEVGLGRLGLAPAAFWAMSLPEWAAALAGLRAQSGGAEGEALSRAEFDALVARYPDMEAE